MKFTVYSKVRGKDESFEAEPFLCPNCELSKMRPIELDVEFRGEVYDQWQCKDCTGVYLDWRAHE